MTDLADERTNGPADHTPAGAAMDHVLPTLADLAAADQRTRRAVLTADQRVRTEDAAADRKMRTKAAEVRLRREERQVRRSERVEARRTRREEKAEKSAARRTRREQAAARMRTRIVARVEYARTNAPAVYSAVIYAVALSVAVGGQVSISAAKGWPLIYGVGMAVFVEGMALAMALTAHQLRLQRERALAPRVLTWVAAMFAASINWWAHDADPVLAAVLAASSLAGITVWEIRSGAKWRPILRDRGDLPEPPEQWGWRRWLRYLPSTFAAWSLDIQTRLSPRGAALLASAQANRQARRARRGHRRLVRMARVAVLASSWRGPSHALVALDLIARTSPPVHAPAIPPPARRTPEPDPRREVHPDPNPTPPDRTEDTDTDPQRTEVRDIGSTNDERYLALVRATHPDGVPTWTQVHNAIRMPGVKDSKSRTTRVHKKIKAERETADDAKEREPNDPDLVGAAV